MHDPGLPSFVGGCKTGTDYQPDSGTLNPQTGDCVCPPPAGGGVGLSVPNTGQC